MTLHARLSFYIGRHFLTAFLTSLAAVLALILLLDTIELMRRSASYADVGIGLLLKMALLKSPSMAFDILPFAVLIGSMAAMWRFSRDHELVVIRSVGISVWRFLLPALILAFALGLFEMTVLNPLAAFCFRVYSRMENSFILRKQEFFDLSQGGLWFREPLENNGQRILYASTVFQEKNELNIYNISFIFVDENNRLIKRIESPVGNLKEKYFYLKDAWTIASGKPNEYDEFITLSTSLTPSILKEKFVSPESLSFWSLPKFIEFYKNSGFSVNRHQMYFYSLLILPFLLCAMVLTAAVFSIPATNRSGRGLVRVLGAVSAGFLFYFFSRLATAFGINSTLPLWASASIPTVIVLILSVTCLLHFEDG